MTSTRNLEAALLLGETNGWCHWFGAANGVPCTTSVHDLDLVLYVRPVLTADRQGVELVDQHGRQRGLNLLPRSGAVIA